ncbi:Cyclic nucleotide-binding [Cordyceps militaris]|uniref:Cyclic nucleotide-binding n=1 Tax=Cordyceps militaris TaxID=73501 RepID=A0A2H4SJI7_CORMI|nr:Cyclic nucleotide-binding [Cordyceps militaris]
MRRNRSSGSSSPFRALAHHHPPIALGDSVSLIRSFNVETNPARPARPSPLTASTIRDMPLDLVDRLRSFPLFQSAPEDFLVEIGNHLKPQVQAANDHVVTEGDDAKAMYWLVRGVVAVTSRDGEAVYAELKSGAFFGEIGVLMDMPRTATIVARTKCLLFILKKEDLQMIMPKFPQMEQAIREEAQERLTLLKKKRQEGNSLLKSPSGEIGARTAAPGEVSRGDTGTLKDGAVFNSKKRKSPSPGIIEDPAVGSAIGSGYVNIRHTLRELPLFSNLPPEILHFLGLSAQPKMYPPFKDIVEQGTSGSEIFFIVQGEAEVIHHSAKGASVKGMRIPQRPRLKAGQYFGEVSSLGLSRERTATVRSITTVECLMIPGDTLDELWRRCPADIRAQVEETARTRMNQKEDDIEMTDAGGKPRSAYSDPPTPSTTPSQPQPPHLTLTNPSKPVSPSKDDSDRMEPKDPDPFLSVNMENLRNRRRHSLAPPVPTVDHSSRLNGGLPSPDGTTLKFAFSQTSLDSDVPAKRARRSSRPTPGSTGPVLSDAILVRIFAYFDVVQLLRLRIVNSHWQRIITTHQDVCKNVDLSSYNRHVTDQVLTQVLAPFIGTRARMVDLNNCFHITDDGFSALWKSCGKNVRSWKMRSVWDVSASQILDMSESAKELQEVDWSNCRKVGDNLLGRVVGWVVPERSPLIQKKVPAHSQKKTKSRQHTEPANENPPPPGTVIGCPKLNTLNLSYCKHITDRSMAHLAAHASDRIRSLSLTRCTSITDAGFQAWAQYKFEKLTHLCLADCTYLSDHAIVALVNAAKSLTHLDLSFCCALSDTATEVVALGLPRLRELRLAFCGSAQAGNWQSLRPTDIYSHLARIVILQSPPLRIQQTTRFTLRTHAHTYTMSFTLSIRQGPARLAQRLPELTQRSSTSVLRAIAAAPARRFHQASPTGARKPILATTTTTRSVFRQNGSIRFYSQNGGQYQQQTASSTASSGTRKLLVGGAIFGGTLMAINLVFNRETREDGGMPIYEREYLNNTFLHTGLGVGIIALTARQMIQTGFVYRIMTTNPWVVGIGGLALSFATMIGTRSISPDNYLPKYALWTAFNATQAAFVAPMLAFVPGALLARAGLYTVAMMGSLAVVGATAKQEKYLYIGGPLLAGAAIVAASGFAPLLLPVTAVRTLAFTENIWLYGGLAVFGGFTLYDVQKVLHHARLAQAGYMKRDPVNESISLELDFLNIFIRMVQLLSMNQRRK